MVRILHSFVNFFLGWSAAVTKAELAVARKQPRKKL
jgi:hypothetical protein